MRIGIVGYGTVGKSLARFFRRCPQNEIVIFDKFMTNLDTENARASINTADLAFIAVPTPTSEDGYSADISAVSESIDWITVPICIRSTIPPGTTKSFMKTSGKLIAFSPEYIGESPDHPWPNETDCGFLIVGGEPDLYDRICSAYKTLVSDSFRFANTDPTTAELCKYMENCFLATKVAFVNQFFDIAQSLSVDFNELRALWLLDSRVGDSHTTVRTARGFGGRCLPKDLRAMLSVMKSAGGAPLLEAVHAYNVSLEKPAGLPPVIGPSL